MPTYSIRANNKSVELALPATDTEVDPARILEDTSWHHASYALYEDIHADCENPPADFDKRAGEDELEEVDMAETEQVIVRHKFRD
ncbi:hypothetical protein [Halococcus saccharolyticus]|uniref:Uncharacterized protein n=1 Tax=Halococcus saccharolyticus DSM 5350 TaxID=1227455 RepID=M0MPH7_9EURY|nr:hypothetical protein [Halococcus saccharolyticus]EMA47607.1 hypothetical protein C449_01052 [Halococcus saccharolyticus DSM 5350]